jgi:hypothetical protein
VKVSDLRTPPAEALLHHHRVGRLDAVGDATQVDVDDRFQSWIFSNTPGLVIDGEVRSVGRISSPGEIAEWLMASA